MIPTKQQRRLILLAVLMISFSCKKEETLEPNPQVNTVLISGKVYPTISIGKQVWTTINYTGPGGLPYRKNNERVDYGRYYTLDEAKAIPVPTGWRLPTQQDYITLAESQGIVFTNNRATGQEASKKLAATTNWRSVPGTNTSGFNAHPAGYSYQNSDPMDGDICEFWTTDGVTFSIQESATGKAHNIMFYGNGGPEYRFPIRFVKAQ